jgi:hypothetical protein
MASSSSRSASKAPKRSRDTSPPPMPEKYKLFDITHDFWEKCHDGKYGTEKFLVESYNKRRKLLEEMNKEDQQTILEYHQRIEDRTKNIEEIKKKKKKKNC